MPQIAANKNPLIVSVKWNGVIYKIHKQGAKTACQGYYARLIY